MMEMSDKDFKKKGKIIMNWVEKNKPFAVFLIYVVLLILFVAPLVFLSVEGEVKGFLFTACGAFLVLVRDSAKDFGLDGKVNT